MYFTKWLFKIRLNFYDRFQRFISIKKLINVKTKYSYTHNTSLQFCEASNANKQALKIYNRIY